MQVLALAILIPLLLSNCDSRDETISGYVDQSASWELVSMGGRPVAPGFTLRFPEKGRVSGASGCGPIKAAQSAPYPWIELSALSPSNEECTSPPDHRSALAALPAMGMSEVAGDTLILSDADNVAQLIFHRQGANGAGSPQGRDRGRN